MASEEVLFSAMLGTAGAAQVKIRCSGTISA
jgi:hypothetical protein